MADGSLNLVFERIRKLAGSGDASDRELLERFTARHEPAAFEALLRRHGPTVFGVCRRVLRHEQDAEDVFQATFLVLARRAGSIRQHASLGSWLYGVAYRLALKVKAGAARRRAHERRCAAMAWTEPPDEAAWQELRPVLDRELSRLPEKYRAPLILCYLEGKTHAEAAGVLGWAPGSMSRRLAKALERLRGRLLRHGVALSAGLLTTLLAEQARAAVTAPLVQASCRAAVLAATGQTVTSIVSVHAAALAEGVIQTMLTTKLKAGLALLVTAAAVAVATALAGAGKPVATETPAPQDEPPKPAPAAKAPADLALVPGGALGFARVAVRDVWNSEAMKKVREHPEKAGLGLLTQLEKGLGVPIDNLEAVTLVLLQPPPVHGGLDLAAVFSTSRPYSRDDVRAALVPKGQEKEYKGKKYYAAEEEAPVAVHFATDRLFVVAHARELQRYFDSGGDKPRPLAAAMKLAEQKHAVVAGLSIPEELAQQLKQEQLPPPAAFLKPLLDLRSGSLTIDLNAEARARARLQFPAAEQAEQGKGAVETGLGVLKQLLAAAPPEARKDPFAALVLDEAGAALKTVRVVRQDASVQLTFHTKAAFPLETVLPGIQKARTAANRAQAVNNLRQIVLAMHNYHDTYKHFPPAAVRDKDGKPLLSWRVAILPYIEQNDLYKQFHLDEPWDSEHNKKLLEKMPKIYAPLNVEPKPGTTFFQVFTGKGTPFEDPEGNKFADITDGASYTLLVVEAGKAVPWTKPEDLPYDPNKPLPKLGGQFGDYFLAAICDGSVRALKSQGAEKMIRAMITRNGGEVVEMPPEP